MRATTSCVLAIAAIALLSYSGESAPADELAGRIKGLWSQFKIRVQDAIMQNNPFIATVHASLKHIDEEYSAIKASPEYAKMDETERQNAYLKIALEEMRGVRSKLEQLRAQGARDEALDAKRRELDSELEKLEEKINEAHELPEEVEELTWDSNGEVYDEEEEARKLAELSELQNQEQAAMGWSMSAETKASIKERTRVLLTDLLTNELKSLAFWLLENFLSGGKGDVASMAHLLNGLRIKVVEYVFDVIRDIMNNQSGFQMVRLTSAEAVRGPTTTMSPIELEKQRIEDEKRDKMFDFINSMI